MQPRTRRPCLPASSSRFDALLRPVRDGLYRFALHLTRDPVRADDLLQQAFVVGLSRLEQLDADAAFRAWMSRIMFNTHVNERKRQSRSDDRSDGLDNLVALPSPRRGPDEESERSRLAARIAAALAGLPEDQAQAVWLVDGQGFKYSEAAEILEVPRGTAATLVARGRRRLQDQLRDLAIEQEVVR